MNVLSILVTKIYILDVGMEKEQETRITMEGIGKAGMERNGTKWNGTGTNNKNKVLKAPIVRVYARGINIQALTFVRVSMYGRGIYYPSK